MVKLRAKKLASGNYSLFLDTYHKGKRSKEYLRLIVSDDYTKKRRIKPEDKKTWELAESICAKRKLELIASDHDITMIHKKNANFIEFMERYAVKVNAYRSALNHLKAFAGNELKFKQITPKLMASFQDYLLERVSPNTCNDYFVRLKVVWNKAKKQGIVKNDPFAALDKPKKIQPKREYLTQSELRALTEAKTEIKPIIQAAFLFSCFTGLRFSDVKKLTWDEIKDNTLQFRQQKSQKDLLVIPLTKTAKSILDTLSRDKKHVFSDLPSNAYVNNQLKLWQAQAGITKNLHFHMARHTFAVMALENGVDIYTLSKLMGHSAVSITEIYGQIVDSKKVEAINRIPEIELTNI